MKAVVLAGGLGTRLHPLTVNLPKPMVPLVNQPLISYAIKLLAQHGFDEITVLLYYLPEAISDYLGDGRRFGVRVRYVRAGKDFGTAGAVRAAFENCAEPILVISADLVTNLDLTALLKFHRQKSALATLALVRVKNPLPYGIVITEPDGQIKKFLEKPSWGEVFSDTVNAGVYLLEPQVIPLIAANQKVDFSLDLFPKLLLAGRPIFGRVTDCYWNDVGKIDDYRLSHSELLSSPSGGQRYFDQSVIMPDTVTINGYCHIGRGSSLGQGAVLSNVVIGRDCVIGDGARLSDCVVWDKVEIGASACLDMTVVANNVKIKPSVSLGQGVVIGEAVEIGRAAKVQPFLKIWPRKKIEDESTVCASMIWREQWTKSVFGQYGITGVYGQEISPQFATAIGAAFGTALGKGARLSCSRDSHKVSRLVYRAMIAGVLSAGVDVSNLEMVPMPLNRFEIRSLKSKGGFHVRKSPFDAEVVDLKFFDSHGMDLAPAFEKKVEQIFFAENFAITGIEGVGELSYPFHRVAEEYQAAVFASLEMGSVAKSGLKLVIDYSFGSASQIFPSVLGELGVETLALDAHIDETKITKDKATFERSLQRLTHTVKSGGADLGVMLDTGAEKLFISDEQGCLLDGQRALAIMALLALLSNPQSTIAVPVKESRVIESLAAKCGGRVIRTKNTFRAMMEVAERGEVSFVGEGAGGYIFPAFLPCFDGMFSVCKLVECLNVHKLKISDLLAQVPQVHLVEREIDCPSEQKGTIIRRLVEQKNEADRLELIDGLKFWRGNDWVLVLPDVSRPVIHVLAEAGSEELAGNMLAEYEKLLYKLKEGD